jgi:hypothetical protein
MGSPCDGHGGRDRHMAIPVAVTATVVPGDQQPFPGDREPVPRKWPEPMPMAVRGPGAGPGRGARAGNRGERSAQPRVREAARGPDAEPGGGPGVGRESGGGREGIGRGSGGGRREIGAGPCPGSRCGSRVRGAGAGGSARGLCLKARVRGPRPGATGPRAEARSQCEGWREGPGVGAGSDARPGWSAGVRGRRGGPCPRARPREPVPEPGPEGRNQCGGWRWGQEVGAGPC